MCRPKCVTHVLTRMCYPCAETYLEDVTRWGLGRRCRPVGAVSVLLLAAVGELGGEAGADGAATQGAAFDGGDGQDADPTVGQKYFVGIDHILAAQAALFDFAPADDPFPDDAGTRSAGTRRSAEAVVADEEDIGHAGGDEFGA